jgi:hypothetical protein
VVVHVNSAGPVVYLELERVDDGSRFRAQLTKEESRQLSPLEPGARVFVELQNVRVFS